MYKIQERYYRDDGNVSKWWISRPKKYLSLRRVMQAKHSLLKLNESYIEFYKKHPEYVPVIVMYRIIHTYEGQKKWMLA